VPNPFADLLNPDDNGGGTLLGMVGRALGVPSAMGTIRGEAINNVNQLIQQGRSPQQAVVEYLASPHGKEAFVKDPTLLEALKSNIAVATPPDKQVISTTAGNKSTVLDRNGLQPPVTITQPTEQQQNYSTGAVPKQIVSTKPGETDTVLNPDGSVSMTIVKPTADVQKFQDLSKIANLPPEQIQKMATDNMLIGGRYQVIQKKNSFGDPVDEYIIFDKLQGTATDLAQARRDATRNPGEPAPAPKSLLKEDGTPDYSKVLTGKASMFLGTGVWPSILSTLNSTVSSAVHPSLGMDEGRLATQRQNYLQDFRTALTAFPETVGRTNAIIKEMQRKAQFGWGTDSFDAVNTGIQSYDAIQREIAASENIIKDMSQPKQERANASNAIVGWQRVLRTLPTRDEMVLLANGIKNNSIPGLGAGSAIKAGAEFLTNAAGVAKQELGTAAPAIMGDQSKPAPAAKSAPVPHTREAVETELRRRKLLK
jgi:hypothetical protein